MKYLNRFGVTPCSKVKLKDIDPAFKGHHTPTEATPGNHPPGSPPLPHWTRFHEAGDEMPCSLPPLLSVE
jgi:hypothetical protein